ncbi:MAG: TetR/AcrR family transcriptional regulator, partial [Gaiellaceae bacterium]
TEQMFYSLKMRSDISAAAAIRDAAMDLFAQRGFSGVTVRDIAAAASVSAPLVIHHYKSKDGLRRAVDGYAMELLGEMFAKMAEPEVITADAKSMMSFLGEEIDALPTLVPYLRRLLVDGGETAQNLFRTLFEGARAMLADLHANGLATGTDDLDTRAAFLLANDLGAVVLREQIHAVLGIDPVARDGIARWTETLLDVYTNGFLITGKKE